MLKSIKAKILLTVGVYSIISVTLEAIILKFVAQNNIILVISVIALVFLALIFTFFLTNTFLFSKLTKLNDSLNKVKDPLNPADRLEIIGDDDFTSVAKNINSILDDFAKYKLAIENASEHIVITDPEGIIIYANKAAERLTGFTFAEMKTTTPRLWGKQMPHDTYNNLWETIKVKKITYEGDLTNKNKNGNLYPVRAKITPILDAGGNVKFFVGIESDISAEQRLKENLMLENQQVSQKIQVQTQAIEDEKAKLLGLINSISLGFIMFDSDGQILFTNPAVEKLTGSLINGRNIDEVDAIFGKDFAVKEKFQKCLLEKQQIVGKNTVFENKYLRLLVSPIFSSKELMSLLGVAILIEDNTEAKMAERSKDEFFSIASHELRTPLTAIRGNTSLLKTYKDKLSSQETEAMIEDINSASVRLIGIVNDFLDTSRLESGKITFKKDPIDLARLSEEAIREYQTTGSLKMLYLTFVSPASPLENVIGDQDRVKQVLVNLVGNAVKYTDKGGVIITLERDNGFIKVLITDTGIGIPPEQHAALFNKFHEVPGKENYTRNVIEGTGLGLYISKMMVEGMDGKIALEKSVVGIGSTFSFELPVIKETA